MKASSNMAIILLHPIIGIEKQKLPKHRLYHECSCVFHQEGGLAKPGNRNVQATVQHCVRQR